MGVKETEMVRRAWQKWLGERCRERGVKATGCHFGRLHEEMMFVRDLGRRGSKSCR